MLSGCDVYDQTADDKTLSECEVLLAWPFRAKRQLLSKMKKLKMVQTLSAGVDDMDFDALPQGVQVFSNAGAYTETAAEHAWGIALGVAKGVHNGRKRLPPRHLRSKVLLVVGCGAIGCEVARLARSSLGMTTVGVSRSFKSPELFDETHPLSDLVEVIGKADMIVDSLPLTRETVSVINARVLSKAKETAILVNIGRGATVDEADVTAWLKERPESRYATDVFWKREGREAFDSPIWDLPNFGGTMHTASAQDREALVNAEIAAARNVKLFLETGTARNRVNISEYVS